MTYNTNTHPNQPPIPGISVEPQNAVPGKSIERALFIKIIETAINCGEYGFARQNALHWLTAFPGDLKVSQLYAQSLMGEKRWVDAYRIVKGLCLADPEDIVNVRMWLGLENNSAARVGSNSNNGGANKSPGALPEARPEIINELRNWATALEGVGNSNIREFSKSDPGQTVPQPDQPGWGVRLFAVRKDLQNGDFTAAEENLPAILGQEPISPLAAVTHLKILQADPNTPLSARRSLAEFYHRKWPDCLACTLFLATWLLQEGVTDKAVALLHQATARDIAGQIANSILGAKHPYRSLWPDDFSLSMELSIPANVAAVLGWNQLSPGDPTQIIPPPPERVPSEDAVAAALIGVDERTGVADDLSWALASAAVIGKSQANNDVKGKVGKEDALQFGAELERLAADFDQLSPSQFDGRLPVYVIFSVHGQLVKVYGVQGAKQIEEEMQNLSQAILKSQSGAHKGRKGRLSHWSSRLYLPDSAENTSASGLQVTKGIDPWNLKLALADLDKALGKRGEMIGALLIVGGPEIVPFHNLPNPVDDPDREVPSDNPYATRDDNYFIPEWPVGRLPGGAGNDPSYLIQTLRQIRLRKISQPKRAARNSKLLYWITRFFHPSNGQIRKGYGYSAAVWRRASFQVYRPVGESKAVLISPPVATNGNGKQNKPDSLPVARLAYFNLHGLADAAEWYGQRDPEISSSNAPPGNGQNPMDSVDYPVALRPEDVAALGENTPLVVFSEACYGAHIQNKTVNQAIALQFLQSGTQAVVGSTTMSYGAINAPLIAADLLGYEFWKALLEGLTAGEALQRAKIRLASEMHQRQGYLDGEDQKTMISFALYGDPLFRLSEDVRQAKQLRRLASSPPMVKLVCDRFDGEYPTNGAKPPNIGSDTNQIPPELSNYIKHVLADYLPGMTDAHITYNAERAACIAHGHTCPTGQSNAKNLPSRAPDRHVVVLNKTIQKAGLAHPRYARLTLDSEGKLVKIVVSR